MEPASNKNTSQILSLRDGVHFFLIFITIFQYAYQYIQDGLKRKFLKKKKKSEINKDPSKYTFLRFGTFLDHILPGLHMYIEYR